MKTKVKICGLTRARDVACAVACGADYLGFVLYPKSPRFVLPERLSELVEEIPSGVVRVGVVVNADAVFLTECIDAGGLDVIQFHGDETPEALAAFAAATAWKALPLGDAEDLVVAEGFDTELVVVDAASTKGRGGTGERCNWELAGRLAADRRILLAGGLTPANVSDAVDRVRPFGVDVSSGVEEAPGRKDHAAVRRFCENVQAIDRSGHPAGPAE